MHRLGVDQVVVVQYQHHLALAGLGGQVVDQGRHQLLQGRRRRRAEQRRLPLGDLRAPGPARRSACRQNRAGSLSPASSDSQATGRRPRRAQSASRAVLPNPAGAHTSISPRASPASSAPPGADGAQNPAAAGQVQLGGQQPIRPPAPATSRSVQPSPSCPTDRHPGALIVKRSPGGVTTTAPRPDRRPPRPRARPLPQPRRRHPLHLRLPASPAQVRKTPPPTAPPGDDPTLASRLASR